MMYSLALILNSLFITSAVMISDCNWKASKILMLILLYIFHELISKIRKAFAVCIFFDKIFGITLISEVEMKGIERYDPSC
jgi:hypothetical protein